MQTRWLVACLALLVSPSAWAKVPVAVLTDGSAAARELERRVMLDAGFTRVPAADAQLVWVIGEVPARTWQPLLPRLRNGSAGLVLVPGQRRPELGELGTTAAASRSSPVTLQAGPGAGRTLGEQVVWPSAPQAGRRWDLEPALGAALRPVVVEAGTARPVVLLGDLARGRVAVFGLQLTEESNRELILWPYFNYLLYALSCEVIRQPARDFADWPAAPLPGGRALSTLLAGLILAWVTTLAFFVKARRYSAAHPEILERFFASSPAPPGRDGPVAPRPRSEASWARVGFTRPLAGFLTLSGAMFLLFAPYYYLTNILIPNDVQPFPQAKGMWEFAWEALQVAWFLFDAGTFVAFVKYFAEYRLKEPAEALRSTQFFVWWQILTGLVQVTVAILAATLILPRTRYGYSSNLVILIGLSQYPGFFSVVTFFFQAYQRFDYNVALDLLSDWVLRFAMTIPCVLLFRAWGAAHPEYGEAMGAAMGLGVGYYLATIVTFLIGVVLYRRLGLRLLPLFLAHFDRRSAVRMLRYGSKVVAGQAFFRAATTVDRVVISMLLLNYTEWLAIQGQIQFNLMFLIPIAYRFFETAMAALSESHGNNKPALTQYYLVRFTQVGSLYTAIGLSLLWALGPGFIRHAMDPQWARAADYIGIAGATLAFAAPAWLSDMLQKGAGRPGLFAWVLGIEQVLRISLFWVLIPLWQFYGYYAALLITIVMKVGGAWLINHRLIIRLRLFPWQMFIAPALAGLLNFGVLRFASGALALSGRLSVILFFFGAALLSFFICFFGCGLAGGFDRALAGELDQASRMTGALRPLTRTFYWAARAGWSLSPLHDRFAVSIEPAAMAEARELEATAAQSKH